MSRADGTRASHVVRGLQKHERFDPAVYLLAEQVHTATGADVEGVQIADVLFVPRWPSGRGRTHGVEVKIDEVDALREAQRHTKNLRFRRLCRWFSYAVPSPWKNVFRSKGDVPEGCGLYSVGAGGVEEVVPPTENKAPPLDLDLFCSIARSLDRAAQRPADGLPCEEDAPWQAITRPNLSRFTVGLACLHAAPRPPGKSLPRAVRCLSCAKDLPPDVEVLERVLVEMPVSEAQAMVRRVGLVGLLEREELDDQAEDLPAFVEGVDICVHRRAALLASFGPGYHGDPHAIGCDGCGAAKDEPCIEQRAEEEESGPGLVRTAPPKLRIAAAGGER